jgi:hypothetical protein
MPAVNKKSVTFTATKLLLAGVSLAEKKFSFTISFICFII